MTHVLAYDHVSKGQLQSLCEENAVKLVGYAPSLSQEGAVHALVESEAQVVLVHIDIEGCWQTLLQRLGATRVAVRFSTETQPPTPPEGAGRNGFRCLKSVGLHGLSNDDFSALVKVFGDPSAIAGLRAGIIPPSISGLVRFREPNHLRALHILLQGVLVQWAADPGSRRGQRAREIVGTCRFPPSAKRIDECGVFWTCLGLAKQDEDACTGATRFLESLSAELGVTNLEDIKESAARQHASTKADDFVTLVKAIMKGPREGNLSESPVLRDGDVVLEGFQWLDKELGQ